MSQFTVLHETITRLSGTLGPERGIDDFFADIDKMFACADNLDNAELVKLLELPPTIISFREPYYSFVFDILQERGIQSHDSSNDIVQRLAIYGEDSVKRFSESIALKER